MDQSYVCALIAMMVRGSPPVGPSCCFPREALEAGGVLLDREPPRVCVCTCVCVRGVGGYARELCPVPPGSSPRRVGLPVPGQAEECRAPGGGGRAWGGAAGPPVQPRPPALPGWQVWSITYHSWLTFVLLLWACLIWTVRSRHQLAMLCSPFILLYGLALCGLRYVWAMDLRPELPTTLGPVSLRQLGLEHTRSPCLDLGAMVSVPRNSRAPGPQLR